MLTLAYGRQNEEVSQHLIFLNPTSLWCVYRHIMSHFKSLFIIALGTIDDDLIVSAMGWLEHIGAWGLGSLLAAIVLDWLKYWKQNDQCLRSNQWLLMRDARLEIAIRSLLLKVLEEYQCWGCCHQQPYETCLL